MTFEAEVARLTPLFQRAGESPTSFITPEPRSY
jgi:hypothetical protein